MAAAGLAIYQAGLGLYIVLGLFMLQRRHFGNLVVDFSSKFINSGSFSCGYRSVNGVKLLYVAAE